MHFSNNVNTITYGSRNIMLIRSSEMDISVLFFIVFLCKYDYCVYKMALLSNCTYLGKFLFLRMYIICDNSFIILMEEAYIWRRRD